MGDSSKVLTAFTTTANGEDDLHPRVLLFQLDESTQTALCLIDRHLGISPLVAQLPQLSFSKVVANTSSAFWTYIDCAIFLHPVRIPD